MNDFADTPELAYRRKVRFAAEVLDALTLERITHGLELRASGMQAPAVVNWGGLFVWLEDGSAAGPQQITVDPGALPYGAATAAAPVAPQRLVQIALAPGRGYRFAPGTTALRLTLIESDSGPRAPVAGAELWLRWIGPGDGGSSWTDSPVRSRSDQRGDATVALRFAPADDPGKDAAGKLRVQLWAQRGTDVASAGELALAPGRVTDSTAPFAWNLFNP